MQENRFCVIGNPVEHSRSPEMQNAAFRSVRLPYTYSKRFCENSEEAFLATLKELKEQGFIGANVTVPFKKLAYKYANFHDEFSNRCGASNVLRWKSDGLHAYNTDGEGFLLAALNLLKKDSLNAVKIAILGACGGAGHAIAHQCHISGAELTLVNRNRPELYTLAETLSTRAITFDDKQLTKSLSEMDLIVNATSLGLRDTDPLPFDIRTVAEHANPYVMDIVPKETPLIKLSKAFEVPCSDGLEMLLWQGVLAFKKWFPHLEAPVDEMRKALNQGTPQLLEKD